MNMDPLGEEYYEWSVYNYTMNNPIRFIDPDGRSVDWKPDKNGNLISEFKDNAQSLARHLNIGEKQAQGMLKKQGIRNTNDELVHNNDEVMSGQTVTINNNMTDAIDRSNGVTLSESNPYKSTRGTDAINDNYICDQASMMAVNGEEITAQNAQYNYSQYSAFFNPIGYTEVENFDDVSFGKGVGVIGKGLKQHIVVNYGQSNNGTQYVFSKAGRAFKPEVISLKNVMEQYNTTKVKFYEKNK